MRKFMSFGALAIIVSMPFFILTACKSEDARSLYEIEAEYFSEEGKIEGNMKVTFSNNTENVLEAVPFALYANMFQEGAETAPVSELFSSACYYDGDSYGGIGINGVTGATSWEVAGTDESVLTVNLTKPLYPDECVSIGISYTLSLAKANHRLGIGEHCVNLSYFYPMLPAQGESGFCEYLPSGYGEPFVLDCADFNITLTVPEDIDVACGGEKEETTENGKKVVNYKAEGVRDAAFVLGNFTLLSADQDGVRIDYYYLTDETAQDTLEAACAAVQTYSGLFGEYPYQRYVLAETDLCFGGMEYCGFAMISSTLRGEERTTVVAHETAHQWWYGSVGSHQENCAWQDEGLAEYSVALFYESNPDYGVSYHDVVSVCESAYRNYFSVKSQLSGDTDTGMSRPLNEFSGDYEYRILSYDKGVVLFDRLRETMGDRKFFSALKSYAAKYAGKLASEYDLISCFSSEEALILSFTEGRCVI